MRGILVGGLLSIIAFPDSLRADKWGDPEPAIYASSGGQFALKRLPSTEKDGPIGILFTINEKGEDKIIWKKPLVNLPVRAMVSDLGDMVTIDQWGSAGHKHALVIYDKKGGVLKDYELEQFLTREEIKKHITHSVSSRFWDKEARFEFDAARRFCLVLTMKWGKVIYFSLKDGTIIDAPE